MSERPTLAECLYWRDTLCAEWAQGDKDLALDDAQEASENLYFQRFDYWVPQGHSVVKTGSAPSDANAAIDSLVPKDVQVRVRPARAKRKYEDQAARLTRAAKGFLYQWRRHKDVLRLFAADQVIRHVAVGRVLYDDSRWPPRPSDWETLDDEVRDDWEAYNRVQCPIIWEYRNPRHVRWRLTDTGDLLAVVEDYLTTVTEARLAFGGWGTMNDILRGREPNELVRVNDIWVGRYRCLLVEDRPVFPVGAGTRNHGVGVHGYPRIPYVIAPFRELPFDSPGDRYRGMLTDARHLYQVESQVLSMHISQLAWNAWRTWAGWLKDGRPLEIRPGTMIQVDKRVGEYLEMLKGEPVPPELLQMISVVDAMLQRNSVSQGPRTQEGTRSAQQIWAIQSLRGMKIDPARGNLEMAVANAIALTFMLIDLVVRETIILPVPGRTRDGRDEGEVEIGPRDIQGYYSGVEVSFGRRLDPAMLEQANALQQLAAANWLPLKKSWELSGLTDTPDEWERELYQQAIDRLPPIMELSALHETREAYGEEDWRYLKLEQMLQEQEQQKQLQQAQAMQGSPGAPSPGVGAGPAPTPRATEQDTRGSMGGQGGNQPNFNNLPGMRRPTPTPNRSVVGAGVPT